MTIDKAIQLLREAEKSLAAHGFHDNADASNLGIHALEHHQFRREHPELYIFDHLPGETED